jgi:ATP-dependent DNA helicase HFM1/MER3
MDSSYEPLILKKRKTSRGQIGFEDNALDAGEVTPMDSESIEARVSPTNTAEKCRRILNGTSGKSHVLFAGTRNSPSEKGKMLIATSSNENSVVFVCKGDSPLEKIKALCRTPDESPFRKTPYESCPQFASKSDGPFGKSESCPAEKKTLIAITEESPAGFEGKRDSPLEKIKAMCRTSDQNSLQFAVKSDSSSEKSKILIATPEESPAGFAGKRDSPLEKIKVMSRTSDQNSLQFAAKSDGSSGNSNICRYDKSMMMIATPEENPAAFAAKKGSPLEKIKALCRTSDQNSLQFAAKSDSSSGKSNFYPSEKSKMIATPEASPAGFAGKKDSPLEKIKAICRTSDESSLQISANSEGSEKTKSCFGSPLSSFQPTQFNVADPSFNLQDYIKYIMGNPKDSDGGFFGRKSVFSFL